MKYTQNTQVLDWIKARKTKPNETGNYFINIENERPESNEDSIWFWNEFKATDIDMAFEMAKDLQNHLLKEKLFIIPGFKNHGEYIHYIVVRAQIQ